MVGAVKAVALCAIFRFIIYSRAVHWETMQTEISLPCATDVTNEYICGTMPSDHLCPSTGRCRTITVFVGVEMMFFADVVSAHYRARVGPWHVASAGPTSAAYTCASINKRMAANSIARLLAAAACFFGRVERVQTLDATTSPVLDSRNISSFTQGFVWFGTSPAVESKRDHGRWAQFGD